MDAQEPETPSTVPIGDFEEQRNLLEQTEAVLRQTRLELAVKGEQVARLTRIVDVLLDVHKGTFT